MTAVLLPVWVLNLASARAARLQSCKAVFSSRGCRTESHPAKSSCGLSAADHPQQPVGRALMHPPHMPLPLMQCKQAVESNSRPTILTLA